MARRSSRSTTIEGDLIGTFRELVRLTGEFGVHVEEKLEPVTLESIRCRLMLRSLPASASGEAAAALKAAVEGSTSKGQADLS